MTDVAPNFLLITRAVEELFTTRWHGQNDKNPVTGTDYVHGIDPVEPQMEAARRALLAREWHAVYGPADAQPLPLWGENWKPGLLAHLLKLYGRSLANRNHDVTKHPSFADYVSGVLWEAGRIDGIIGSLPIYPDELSILKKRFPPQKLAGMGPGFCWLPFNLYASYLQNCAREGARHTKVGKSRA
jgi:hypothetical protein